MMTYDEARIKFKEIAGNRYRAMYHELREYGNISNNEIEQQVRLYIDGGISTGTHNNWEDALEELQKLLYPVKEPTILQCPDLIELTFTISKDTTSSPAISGGIPACVILEDKVPATWENP